MVSKGREMTANEARVKQSWMGRSMAERRQHMPNILVSHPQFTHAIDEISRRRTRVREQLKGAALCIVAATGGGKTTLAKKIQALNPNVETDEISIRRTVYFSVPPRPSSSAMSSAVLYALGDPRWDKGRADALESRMIHLLIRCGTEIILMDNTHDIPERRKATGVREVGNWVRNVIDNVPALFVSLGAEQGLDVFKANSQVRRRSPANIKINYFDCRSKKDLATLRRFLHELDIQLPLSELSNLGSFDTTKRIWIATNGIPDYILHLLTEAMESACNDGREVIHKSDLEAAFFSLFQDGCPAINPFSAESNQLRMLDQEGDPFEEWLEDGYE